MEVLNLSNRGWDQGLFERQQSRLLFEPFIYATSLSYNV
jgi:hypothetical protein